MKNSCKGSSSLETILTVISPLQSFIQVGYLDPAVSPDTSRRPSSLPIPPFILTQHKRRLWKVICRDRILLGVLFLIGGLFGESRDAGNVSVSSFPSCTVPTWTVVTRVPGVNELLPTGNPLNSEHIPAGAAFLFCLL